MVCLEKTKKQVTQINIQQSITASVSEILRETEEVRMLPYRQSAALYSLQKKLFCAAGTRFGNAPGSANPTQP
jgi:hypothetical protein